MPRMSTWSPRSEYAEPDWHKCRCEVLSEWSFFKNDTVSGMCSIDFRSDFSFPSLNVYSEWGLAGHFRWTCSVSCSPGDRTQTKFLSLRVQFPRWPRRILGFKDSGKALLSSSFHRENGLGPTGLRKLSLSHLWLYDQSWSGEDSQGFKAAHWVKPQGLCLPSSDKLNFFLDGGKSLQVPGTGGQCHPKLFRLPGKSISNYKTQVLSSTSHCKFSVRSIL